MTRARRRSTQLASFACGFVQLRSPKGRLRRGLTAGSMARALGSPSSRGMVRVFDTKEQINDPDQPQHRPQTQPPHLPRHRRRPEVLLDADRRRVA